MECIEIHVGENKMDNIKGLMKKVKKTDDIHIISKASVENGMNLKTMRKELEEKMNEKAKIYGFIGMEIYDLSKENKVEIPQIKNYLDKMNEINLAIENIEKQIKEKEAKNAGKRICACGCKLKPQDRFCPNCGEVVPRDTVICSCGAELNKNSRFCNSCGKSMEAILKEQQVPGQQPIKECICGAKVPVGQFMCLECGRKIE